MSHWGHLQEMDALKVEGNILNSSDIDAIEWAVDTLTSIQSWCRAYPLSAFPEPDFGKADKVLKEAGISLSAISGSNMRHVCEGIQRLIDQSDK